MEAVTMSIRGYITRIQTSFLNMTRPRAYTLTAQQDSNESKTLALPDGRVLGYAEYGHPEGRPLLYFHGFPASRAEAWGVHKIARRHRIRIIAIDRPGFGLSTFQPGRRITDWPADVLALAEHVNLKRFAVMGTSGGGPYALACAHALPRQMMFAVGVVAGGPPWAAGAEHMLMSARATSWAASNMPSMLGIVAQTLVVVARWIVTSGPVTRRIDAWLESEQKKRDAEAKKDDAKQENMDDDEQFTTAERRERLFRVLFDGFNQGPKAFVQEARLLSAQDWGFELEDISYDPILIWHGTKDTNAPISMIQYMAKRIPHAVLHQCEGDTHYSMHKHLETILMELIPE
jgi:pimeloyl-ACP methyl ester carboxylesterase